MSRLLETRDFTDEKGMALPLETRLENLAETLGLTGGEFNTLETISKKEVVVFEDIWNIATVFYNAMKALKMDTDEILSNISQGNLALVLGSPDIRASGGMIGGQIQRKYRPKRTNTDITFPDLLRRDIFQTIENKEYVSNRESADKAHGDINFSNTDVLKGIRVPEKIGLKEIFYLAIVTAAATCRNPEGGTSKRTPSAKIYANGNHLEFYNKVFIPLSQTLFNKKQEDMEPSQLHVPLESTAIYEWLKKYDGVGSINGTVAPFNNFKIREHKGHLIPPGMPREEYLLAAYKAQLAGFISSEGFMKDDKKYIVISSTKRPELLEFIKNTAEKAGYQTQFIAKGTRLTFREAEIERMTHEFDINRMLGLGGSGLFVNPYHIAKLNNSNHLM